jgi:hypothetical protein
MSLFVSQGHYTPHCQALLDFLPEELKYSHRKANYENKLERAKQGRMYDFLSTELTNAHLMLTEKNFWQDPNNTSSENLMTTQRQLAKLVAGIADKLALIRSLFLGQDVSEAIDLTMQDFTKRIQKMEEKVESQYPTFLEHGNLLEVANQEPYYLLDRFSCLQASLIDCENNCDKEHREQAYTSILHLLVDVAALYVRFAEKCVPADNPVISPTVLSPKV